MKKTLKFAALAALLVVSAIGMAQGGGGGGGGGRGQGGGRMMMMGGGPGGNRLMLLSRKDVRDDLGITAEQQAKLDEMRKKMEEEMRTNMENAQASGGGFQGMQDSMRKMMETYQKQGDEILTEAQRTRLKEISYQMRGNSAISDPEVQKELGITSAQKDQIEALQTKQREAMMALRDKMQNGEMDRDQMREVSTKNQKVMADELGKILTQEQADKLKALGGTKPFKADPNERGMRIGGGGGGGF